MSRSTDPAPVACSLGRDDLAERRARWQRLGESAGIEVVPTEHAWSVSESGANVVLEVSGSSDDAIVAVQAMFGSLRGPD